MFLLGWVFSVRRLNISGTGSKLWMIAFGNMRLRAMESDPSCEPQSIITGFEGRYFLKIPLLMVYISAGLIKDNSCSK